MTRDQVKRLSMAQLIARLIDAEKTADDWLIRFGYASENTRAALEDEKALQQETWRRGFMI